MRKSYCADFETTTDINDCRVWVAGIREIYNDDSFEYEININDFVYNISLKSPCCIYFRNLKFDGEFLLNYLLENNYKYVETKKLNENEFSCLIGERGQFYCIRIGFKNGICEIRDSLKIINMSIADTAKAFGMNVSKGDIDYHEYRPIGYQPTKEELDYLYRDVTIDAYSLRVFFDVGLNKMTQGSDALMDFKNIIGKKNFKRRFPVLKPLVDDYCRKSYKGGFVYVSPEHKGKHIKHSGCVADVNSLFPYTMSHYKLPYGEPVYYKGKYIPNKLYDLYICHIKCAFQIKPGYIPTIQIKHTLSFQETEYLESSNYEIVDLWLTSVDYELFMKHYDVYNIQYIDGYCFRSMIHKEFVEYVNKWGKVKIEAGEHGNKGMRTLAKLMMNCLYGKFGTARKIRHKIPYLEDGIVKYKLSPEEEKDGIYVPVATFITAWARYQTISASQKIKEYSESKYGKNYYLYSDTDSIHTLLSPEEVSEILNVDDFELGKWAIESKFTECKFLRQKCYLETIDGKLHPTVAGLPKDMHDIVTYENFTEGTIFGNPDTKTMLKIEKKKENHVIVPAKEGKEKKRFKHVKGGVVLVPTTFQIKG